MDKCQLPGIQGLVHYGYTEEAKELAEKTILLLGRDYERFGALHEYYLPDNGEPGTEQRVPELESPRSEHGGMARRERGCLGILIHSTTPPFLHQPIKTAPPR